MRTVYIIPGFTETTKLKGYQEVIKYFRLKGLKAVEVKIQWKNKTMTDYVDQFLKQYKQGEREGAYLFGFSFGAMVAFISSVKIKPKALFLCSLSPYFREDLIGLKNSWKKAIGKRRMEDFRKYSFDKIAKSVKCKTFIIAGSEEYGKYPNLGKRIRIAHKQINGSKLVLIHGAKHNISQKKYLDDLRKAIESF